MQNIPVVKMGIISVSRSCFPVALSEMRRHNVVMLMVLICMNAPSVVKQNWMQKKQ